MESKPIPRARPRVLTLTPAAVERVRAMMADRPDAGGLKIGIKKGGCAGMEYALSWANAVARFDEVVEQDGARVIIDPAAVLYLLGTQMDWKVDTMSSQFVFDNPNQKSSCGCGESVNLEPADQSRLEELGR
jgi:iron-sulfur cluster assembly protein